MPTYPGEEGLVGVVNKNLRHVGVAVDELVGVVIGGLMGVVIGGLMGVVIGGLVGVVIDGSWQNRECFGNLYVLLREES